MKKAESALRPNNSSILRDRQSLLTLLCLGADPILWFKVQLHGVVVQWPTILKQPNPTWSTRNCLELDGKEHCF
jgi:hypothetical protein